MKKYLINITALLVMGTFSAQVRVVNSATNVSVTNSPAFIDGSSNTTVNGSSNIGKGLIFPRVDLSAMTTFPGVTAGIPNSFPTRFDGMIVYNTATSGAAGVGSTQGTLSPGYWYYENTSATNTGGTWKPVSTATSAVANTASNGLTLAGNDVKLGGTLSQATTINGLSATNTLNISGGPLRLLNGGVSNATTGNEQLLFGYSASQSYKHAVKTRHNSLAQQGNAFDFYTWKPGTDAVTDIGTQLVMTLDGNGNVGVGTNAPTAKLEVNNGTTAGAIKITDGTQGAGKVLTSDANGLATWTNTVTTAFANAWSSASGTLVNPFTGTTGGSGLNTGLSVTIPSKGWYFFRSGLTIVSDCNDYSFYVNGIGDVWKVYCGSSSNQTFVPRDQTRVLYFSAPGTYTVYASKTNAIVPTFNAGNPSFYLDFVKFQN